MRLKNKRLKNIGHTGRTAYTGRVRYNRVLSILTAVACLIGTLNLGVADINAKDKITNAKELESARTSVYESYVKSISSRKDELDSGKIKIGNYTMTYTVEYIGKPDENGYPIYFGLHGGGTPDTAVQKEQYEFMQDYYNNSISSGIYIVPLSLEARYDEHYIAEAFLFYDRLIEDAVIFKNGDPNRVYMMGFSSGGDGIYGISPAYADRLAAVNMSAGYPNIQKIENMYNLPICLQVGENDSAYDRNILVAKYDSWLKDLNKKYNGGYVHETFIHKGGSHNDWADVTNKSQMVIGESSIPKWLNNEKNVRYNNAYTDAVDWVSQYTRNPLPERVVWSTNINSKARTSKAFYWLDRDGYLDNTTISASYDKSKNTISIDQCDAKKGTLKVYINSEMVDLFKDVKVSISGKTFTVKPVISTDIMQKTLKARGDINYMFDAEIDITLSDKKDNIKVESVATHNDGYEVKGAENLLTWNDDGLFLVDQSLFSLTYDQLCKKLGAKLNKPQKWEYWGNNLTWTSYDLDDNHGVMFMFQNGKTVIIYNETNGDITNSVKKAAQDVFGAKLSSDGIPRTDSYAGIYMLNIQTIFYLENNVYDGKNHMVQKYVSFDYES